MYDVLILQFYMQPIYIYSFFFTQILGSKHLLQVAKRIPDETSRWELGLNLGVAEHDINVVKRNNPNDFTMANYQMLKKWFATITTRSDADRIKAWKKLESALERSKLNQIISEVFNAEDD